MNDEILEINKKIASSIFNLLITIDEKGNCKTLIKNKCVDIPNYMEDLDATFDLVDFFKKKGYFVSIGYIKKNNKILWNTKISKNKSIYDSNLRNTMQESVCYAALSFISKKAQKKSFESMLKDNIVSINFKK